MDGQSVSQNFRRQGNATRNSRHDLHEVGPTGSMDREPNRKFIQSATRPAGEFERVFSTPVVQGNQVSALRKELTKRTA